LRLSLLHRRSALLSCSLLPLDAAALAMATRQFRTSHEFDLRRYHVS
jgi:hypothetical protein